jgi:SAM-dependent methyltransferase
MGRWGGDPISMFMFATASDRDVLALQLGRLVNMGCVPIALCGAGRVLGMLRHGMGPGLAKFDEHIVGVIDDNPGRRDSMHAGLRVISAEDAGAAGVKAVVITAEGAAQEALWAERGRFIDAGMRVLCCPERFAGQTWDEGLIDQYEWMEAQERGIDRPYARRYPDREEKRDPFVVETIMARLPAGGSVCEIGSGSGKWTASFIERTGEYHCVDYSARLLYEAIEPRFGRQRAKLHLHHDEHAKLAGVPSGAMDVVFSIDVFMHFKVDLTHQFLKAIRRVLKPGGVAVLHFAAWNEAGIERWEKHDGAHHNGGVGPIHPVHMDWLRASATRLGMTCRKIGEDRGWVFLAEFRLA